MSLLWCQTQLYCIFTFNHLNSLPSQVQLMSSFYFILYFMFFKILVYFNYSAILTGPPCSHFIAEETEAQVVNDLPKVTQLRSGTSAENNNLTICSLPGNSGRKEIRPEFGFGCVINTLMQSLAFCLCVIFYYSLIHSHSFSYDDF